MSNKSTAIADQKALLELQLSYEEKTLHLRKKYDADKNQKQYEHEKKLLAYREEYSAKEHQRAMELEKAKMQNLQLEIELAKLKLGGRLKQ